MLNLNINLFLVQYLISPVYIIHLDLANRVANIGPLVETHTETCLSILSWVSVTRLTGPVRLGSDMCIP